MGALAGLCGALIVLFGLLTVRRAPSDAQFGTEVTCLVGGLVLIFLGVVLARLRRVERRLGAPGAARQPGAVRQAGIAPDGEPGAPG